MKKKITNLLMLMLLATFAVSAAPVPLPPAEDPGDGSSTPVYYLSPSESSLSIGDGF